MGGKKSLLSKESDIASIKDPLSQYNFVIKCCNDPINRENQTFLKEVPVSFIHKIWFYLQVKFSWLMIFLYFVPYLSIIILFLNTVNLFISEFSMFVYSSNQMKNPTPLKYMVYNPEICNQAGKSHLYLQISEKEIQRFDFHKEIILMLIERKHAYDFKIRFMVYNDAFLGGYFGIIKARYIVLAHFLLCLLAFVIMHVFVYSDFFCLNITLAKNLVC
jgi:hypothetical protein